MPENICINGEKYNNTRKYEEKYWKKIQKMICNKKLVTVICIN